MTGLERRAQAARRRRLRRIEEEQAQVFEPFKIGPLWSKPDPEEMLAKIRAGDDETFMELYERAHWASALEMYDGASRLRAYIAPYEKDELDEIFENIRALPKAEARWEFLELCEMGDLVDHSEDDDDIEDVRDS